MEPEIQQDDLPDWNPHPVMPMVIVLIGFLGGMAIGLLLSGARRWLCEPPPGAAESSLHETVTESIRSFASLARPTAPRDGGAELKHPDSSLC